MHTAAEYRKFAQECIDSAPPLAGIEHRLAAEHGAPGLGPLDAFVAALADELALELGKAAHDGEDQLAMERRGCRARDHRAP